MRNKKLYIIICIILLLSLASAAVVYHHNAIEDAFNRGKSVGHRKGHTEGFDKGYRYYEEIKDEYSFYHEYAVRVTTTGKKYHRYNCYHVKDRSFYIYNISNAEAKGYTPCLDCYD